MSFPAAAAGSLALLSGLIGCWQFAAARRFPLHRRLPTNGFHPSVSILRAVRGPEPDGPANLESWLRQDYPGPWEILVGSRDASDPALAEASALEVTQPPGRLRVENCPQPLGPNQKAATLAQLEPLATGDVIVVSDADVRVPPDLLAQLVAPLADPGIGLVSCFYRFANPRNAAMQCEAVAVNADFWSQVLQSRTLAPQDFALGAVFALRRSDLAALGGFAAVVDFLADDFQIGRRVVALGKRIELCPIPVDCWEPVASWGAVWRHQLRWARTIRTCRPLPYFASIIANATLWPLVWLAVAPTRPVMWTVLYLLLIRLGLAEALYSMMRRGLGTFPRLWTVWVRDLLAAGIWLAAFTGNRVLWRGVSYRVHRDGRLEPLA